MSRSINSPARAVFWIGQTFLLCGSAALLWSGIEWIRATRTAPVVWAETEWLTTKIQSITAPSGEPLVIYDPERARLLIIDRSLPRGTEVCIAQTCLLDTEWSLLGQEQAVSKVTR